MINNKSRGLFTVLKLFLCTPTVLSVNNIFQVNIALNKHATQSGNLTYPGTGDVWSASNAVDGNKDCTNVDKDHFSGTAYEQVPWWQVDLGTIYSLSTIIVYGQSTEFPVQLKGFVVYLSTSANGTDKQKVYTNIAYANGGVFTIAVQSNIFGRYITIEMHGTYRDPHERGGPLVLCEVEAYSTDIIQELKNTLVTYMSPRETYNEPHIHWDKDRAIDNVREFNPNKCGCCSGTSGREIPWWKLELPKPNLIAQLMIYGRSDSGHTDQSDNLFMYGSNGTSENGTQLYHGNPNRANAVYSISLQPPRLFQVLTVRRWIAGSMTICEVKIFPAGCPVGSFGDKCLGWCNCKNGVACDVNTGHCDSCPPGFGGDSCQSPCPHSTYGYNCNETCDTCTQMDCRNTDGLCTIGCVPGYKPDYHFCKEACDDGYYGQNCFESCSGHCKNGNHQCNKINGTCMQGCVDGYIRERCEKACDDGYYGHTCSESCSGYCKNGNHQCNKINGTCMQGCVDGYIGERCEKECAPSRYGENCSQICSTCEGMSCNKTDGLCFNGCVPGYKPDDPYCRKDNNILYRLRNEIKTSMSTVAGNWTSDRAVDGNTGPDPNKCQCCSGTTNAPLSWWMVDFGERVPVNGIAIYSRSNENDIRQLKGFQVILSAKATYNSSSFQSKSLGMLSKMYMIKLEDTLTRYIKIQRPGVLTLCEVKVFQGVCKQGKFGHECAHECHCGDNKPCNQQTGYCQSTACKTGWQGPSCNETCPPETFGDNCSDSCYCAEGTCTNNYGICPGRCRQGYHGAHCNQVGTEVNGESEAKGDTAIIIGAVGGSGTLLFIAVIVGIVVLKLRKRKRDSAKSEYETPNHRVSSTEIQEYDTIDSISGSTYREGPSYTNETVSGF